MRVLITPDWYPWPEEPVFGVFCKEQAHAVAPMVDVTVLAWRPERGLRAPFQLGLEDEDGLRTIRLRHANTRVPRSGFACKVAGLVAIAARLRRAHWRPDVVHAHEYTAAPVAFLLGAMTRAPVIFSEHYSGFALGALDKHELRRARWAFERGHLICPVSANLAEHLAAVAPTAKIKPVPNVVDTDLFVPPEAWRPAATVRFVTVGSLVPVKGHRRLIEAVATLHRRGTRLTLEVIGDGPLRRDLERVTAELGADEVVTFRGRLDRPAVAATLQRSDAFVLSSHWENLPCALIEAMAVGLPAVATRVGGVPEVLGSGEGILVEPDSTDALVDGLSAMAESVSAFDRAALRRKALDAYSRDVIGGRWAEVYASVVDGTAGRR